MSVLLLGCLLLKSHPHIQYQRAVPAVVVVGAVMPFGAGHQFAQLQVHGKQRQTQM